MTYGDNTPHTPANSKSFRDNFDRIFNNQEKAANETQDARTVATKKKCTKRRGDGEAKKA